MIGESVRFVENGRQGSRLVREAAEEQSVHRVGKPGEQTGAGTTAVDDRTVRVGVELGDGDS